MSRALALILTAAAFAATPAGATEEDAYQKTFTAQPEKYVSGAASGSRAPWGTHHDGRT